MYADGLSIFFCRSSGVTRRPECLGVNLPLLSLKLSIRQGGGGRSHIEKVFQFPKISGQDREELIYGYFKEGEKSYVSTSHKMLVHIILSFYKQLNPPKTSDIVQLRYFLHTSSLIIV